MTVPRELSIKNGRLYQWPVRELEEARRDPLSYEHVLLEGERRFPGIEGRTIDLELEIKAAGEEYHSFCVRFGENEDYYTLLTYRPQEGTLQLDRKFSGTKRALLHQRRAQVQAREGVLSLRLVIDRYSAEVIVNQGEKAMTLTYYTDLSAQGISFHADGPVDLTVRKWTIP